MVNKLLGWLNRKDDRSIGEEKPEFKLVLPRMPYKNRNTGKGKPVDAVRSFDGAASTDYNYGWHSPRTSIDGLLKQDLRLLRARSREQVRNNDYALGFIRSTVNNVVGVEGIKLDVLARYEDGVPDAELSKSIENTWLQWSKYKINVDVSAKMNWDEIIAHLCGIYLMDGEIFIRHVFGKGKQGYSLQVIDPELCDVELNGKTNNGNEVIMGVEVDEWRKPVAYWFRSTNSETSQSLTGGHGKHVRVPAQEIIHAYRVIFPDQTRGYPIMATALARMKMVDTWENAALINANYGASLPGMYTRNSDSYDPATTINSDGELIQEIKPGEIPLLPDGYQFTAIDTKYPENEFSDFKKAMLRGICAGMGIDYPTLSQDLESVNYSSARIGMLEAREVYKNLQQWLITNICTPIYETWLLHNLLLGNVKIGRVVVEIDKYERATDVKWLPKRWSWIDPVKDVNAAIAALKYRLKSISTIASEMGVDWQSEIQKIKRDEDQLKELGLTYFDYSFITDNSSNNNTEDN